MEKKAAKNLEIEGATYANEIKVKTIEDSSEKESEEQDEEIELTEE